jgi:hypothetical protein
MQHLEGSGTPVLYIGHTILKGLWGLCLHHALASERNLMYRV